MLYYSRDITPFAEHYKGIPPLSLLTLQGKFTPSLLILQGHPLHSLLMRCSADITPSARIWAELPPMVVLPPWRRGDELDGDAEEGISF